MQNKGLIGLMAAAVVAVIAAVVVVRGGGNERDDPHVGTPVLPEIGRHVDAVARIALVKGDAKTTLVRWGDLWTVEEKGFYPADDVKVRQALLGMAELAFVEPKTRKADLYSRLDLDDPGKKDAKSILLTATDEKGSLLGEAIAGKRRVDQLGGGNDGIYVRKPGDPQSWLAKGTLDLAGDTSAWLDKKLLDMPVATVKSVTLTQPDGTKLAFARAKADDKFALANPPPAPKKLKSEDALDDPAGALAGLELSDVRPAKDFAMPATGTASARFESFDGLVVTVTLAEKDGAQWARIESSGTGDAAKQAAELQAKLGPWVFALPAYKAKTLQTKLDDIVETPKPS